MNHRVLHMIKRRRLRSLSCPFGFAAFVSAKQLFSLFLEPNVKRRCQDLKLPIPCPETQKSRRISAPPPRTRATCARPQKEISAPKTGKDFNVDSAVGVAVQNRLAGRLDSRCPATSHGRRESRGDGIAMRPTRSRRP